MKEIMLTTKDNPFNPFDRWEDWYNWDLAQDNGCCELIGRIAASSSTATPASQQHEYEAAIDNIIKHDPLGIYAKITHEVN